MSIFSLLYPVVAIVLFATFVDRRIREGRIKSSRRGLLSYRRRSFFPSVSAKQIGLPAAPRHFHSSVIRTTLSDFTALTWPKELGMFAPVVYCCCRGDPRRSHRENVIVQSASRALLLSQARRHTQSVPKRVSRTMHYTPLTNDD